MKRTIPIMKKIIDAFRFNNETDLLEDRISYLMDTVDFFCISESKTTFTGNKKKFILKKFLKKKFPSLTEKFIIYENKEHLNHKNVEPVKTLFKDFPATIIHMNKLLKIIKSNKDVWLNDWFQIETLLLCLKRVVDRDSLIVFSDLDEIPDKKFYTQNNVLKNQIVFARMLQLRYNTAIQDEEPWIGSVKFKSHHLKYFSLNQLRFFIKTNERGLNHKIENGGWHFTSFGTIENVRNKLNSFGHQEFNTPINRMLLSSRFKRGYDVFGRQVAFKIINELNLPSQFKNLNKIDSKDKIVKASLIFRVFNFLFINIEKLLRKLRLYFD